MGLFSSIAVSFLFSLSNADSSPNLGSPHVAETGSSAQELMSCTSDAFSGTLNLQLLVDSNGYASQVQYVTSSKTVDFPVTDLSTGIVLLNQGGYNAITIESSHFDTTHGGVVDIHYLNSALSDSYLDLYLDLVNAGNQWELTTTDGSSPEVVTQGYFKANTFFGQVIGIESITLQ